MPLRCRRDMLIGGMMRKYIMVVLLLCLSVNVYGAGASDKAAPSFAGEYKRYLNGKPDRNQAAIKLNDLQGGRVHVEGNAVWVGDINSGDVNSGELDGTFPLNGNMIRYSEDDASGGCRLTIALSDNALRVSDDNMLCGGLNVTFNGEYLKVGVTANDKTDPRPAQAQFVKEFYDNFYPAYKRYMEGNNRKLSDFKKLFEPKNYFTDTLSSLLIDDERRQLAHPGEITGLDFDPFIDAQDDVGKPIVGETKANGAKTLVTVTFSMVPKHKVLIELSSGQGGLVISNIIYPDEKTDLLKLFSKIKEVH